MQGWHEAIDAARREYKTFQLTDDDMRTMTFPHHYEIAGFGRQMRLDRQETNSTEE